MITTMMHEEGLTFRLATAKLTITFCLARAEPTPS